MRTAGSATDAFAWGMLYGMGPAKRGSAKKTPAGSKKAGGTPKKVRATSKKAAPRRSGARSEPAAGAGGFVEAFTALLRSRKVAVPKGLADAPPEAYASQPASFVEQLEQLSNGDLKKFAEKVSSYAARQQARARAEWDSSPLITELRKRKLPEPPPPPRASGVSVSLAKPLAEWSDKEILRAAERWSKLHRS